MSDVFEAERPRLRGLAYRLLGSLDDAEDVVQEAWLRWQRSDRAAIENPAAWLTTTVSRLGLDRLRARSRDRASYVGPWLPEPLVAPAGPDPAEVVEVSDSLTTAFLVLMERLSPLERLVVLLADVFGEPFARVAAVTRQTEAAARQVASRARRKLREEAGEVPEPRRDQRAVAERFAAALVAGDHEGAVALLDPDVHLVSDGGASRRAARRVVRGPERVVRLLANLFSRLPPSATVEPVWVSGDPGWLSRFDGRPWVVQALEVRGGRVVAVRSVLNPDKLAHVDSPVDLV